MTVHSTTRMYLEVETAADLMSNNPVSLREDASLHEALVLFAEKGYTAAPVIDESGRPVGVLSQSDIIVHDREKVNHVPELPEYFRKADLATRGGEHLSGFLVEQVDRTRVGDLMTPAVFSVRDDTPSDKVIEQMLGLNVHRLFVVDRDSVLVGVISATDVVRHLRPER